MTLYSVSTCVSSSECFFGCESQKKKMKKKMRTTQHLTFLSIKNPCNEKWNKHWRIKFIASQFSAAMLRPPAAAFLLCRARVDTLRFALTEKLTKKSVCMHENWSGKLKVNIFAGKFSFLFLNFILFVYYFGIRLHSKTSY